jgi:hypothetical protein
MEKYNRPDLENEMDELQRVVQDLSRDEDINVSVDDLVNLFKKSEEVTLTDEIWENLENTESNEIEKGDMVAVIDIAKTYKKTDPKKLRQSIKSGDYNRPLILKFGKRYHLVAGNTRLCTAAAMGINPKVFIGSINDINEMEKLKGGLSDNKTLQDIAKKHSNNKTYDKVLLGLKQQLTMGLKVEVEHTNNKNEAKEVAMDHLFEDPKYYTKLRKMETNEVTDSGSSGAFSAPMGDTPIKKKINTIHNSKEYNVNEDKTPNDKITLKGLVGKKYDYQVGSGTESSSEPNEDYVLKQIMSAISHYMFDWEFYYNWTENDEKSEYYKTFKEDILKPLILDIDNTLSKYFKLESGFSKKVLKWVPSNEKNDEMIDDFFINNKKISKNLKNNYFTYRKEYAGVNLKTNKPKEGEFTESTTTSSSGQFDVPFGGGTKGRKDPLKIDGVKSIKNSRAVKDKNFPKWGGPDSVFVKIKEKCKKFPYCTQGIDAIELLEMEELNEAVKKTSRDYGITEKELKNLVLNEIKKIFI